MRILFKSHVYGYTKKNGTYVGDFNTCIVKQPEHFHQKKLWTCF